MIYLKEIFIKNLNKFEIGDFLLSLIIIFHNSK